MTTGKPRGAAAVIVALFAGLIAGTAISGSQDIPAPEPARTGYVDVQSVLKDYHPLRAAVARFQREARRDQEKIVVKFEPQIKDQEKIRRESPADSREGREALAKSLDLRARATHEVEIVKLNMELNLRDAGIEAFERVRAKASDVARAEGFTELVNIVGDTTRSKDEMSIKQLERQLMMSPVLMFDEKHNLTEAVRKAVKEQWDPGISMAEEGITCHDDKGVAIAKGKDGEYEIRLGQKVKFGVAVLKKGEPATDDAARLVWDRYGYGTGTMAEESGEYSAPETAPPSGGTFEVVVVSLADPTISKRVTVRLLDKEGNRLPEKKPAGDPPPEKEGEAGGNGKPD